MSVPHPNRDPALVLEHAPYVRALAQALVFDQHLARDLEQDVLLAALENAPRDPRSIKGWLAAIVRNLASKSFRSGARRRERETRAARPDDAVPTPEEILAREDLRRWLLEHLLALDEPVRSAMILRFAEELPPREVARRLRVPLETVRTRLKRGLEELRGRLEREPRKENGLWCLTLVQGLKIGPPNILGAGCKLMGAAIPGVLAVSTTKKALAAAVALAITVYLVGWQLHPLHPALDAQGALPAPDARLSSANEVPASADESAGRSAVRAEPAPKPVVTATNGSVLLKLHWSDGTPAAGVAAGLYCSGAEDFYADAETVLTGDDGTHLCEGLPPGHVAAYLDRGPVGECQLAAGAKAEIEMTIPRGFDISGEVVERDGRPIAGAEILIDRMGNGWNAFRAAHTGSDGRFRIRSAQQGMYWITAHAALHSPSPQVEVYGGSVDIEGVRIVLDGSGASVAGQVLDPQGNPLSGAQVLLGDENAFDQQTLENGQPARAPAAQLVETDESGSFVVAGAPVGRLDVQARWKSLAPWRGEVETATGARAAIVIRMQPGVTLRGRATDASGAPVRAIVYSIDGSAFAHRTKRCADDGTFVMTGIHAGEISPRASADGHEDARTRLVGIPGAELVWNPVLGSGLKISGRLVGQGIDFSNWWMYCESEDWQKSPYGQSARPKADGSFEFKGCGDALHDIRVHAPGASLFAVANVSARPGTELLLVAIDTAMLPTCRVRGRFLDEDGKPLAGVAFTLILANARIAPLETADSKGSFDLGPVPPGEYSVHSNAAGYCALQSEKLTLVANANAEFGDLHLKRGGTIAVHLARAPTKPIGIELWRGDASAGWIRIQDGGGRSDPLEPGEYEFRAWADGERVELPAGSPRASVRVGEETAVELALP